MRHIAGPRCFCSIGRRFIIKANGDGGGGGRVGGDGTEFKYLGFAVIQFEFV